MNCSFEFLLTTAPASRLPYELVLFPGVLLDAPAWAVFLVVLDGFIVVQSLKLLG